MFIFRGFGIVVPIIVFGLMIGTQKIVNHFFEDGQYYSYHLWPKLTACTISAIILWFLGKRLNNQPDRVLIDKKTGQEVVLKRNHTLFGIKIEHWAPIVLVGGILLAAANFKSW